MVAEARTGRSSLRPGIERVKHLLIKVLRYLKENPGTPFIVAFQVMLIICAVLLAYDQEAMANNIAIYAFYSLVVGVILQFIAFLKYSGEEKIHDPFRFSLTTSR